MSPSPTAHNTTCHIDLANNAGMYTNLPGVWPLHCHIGWHLSEGKLAAIVFQPEAIRSIDQPEEWLEVSEPMCFCVVASEADKSISCVAIMTTTSLGLPRGRCLPSRRTSQRLEHGEIRGSHGAVG